MPLAALGQALRIDALDAPIDQLEHGMLGLVQILAALAVLVRRQDLSNHINGAVLRAIAMPRQRIQRILHGLEPCTRQSMDAYGGTGRQGISKPISPYIKLFMNIVQLRVTQSHLEYLTGCRYATLVKLAKVVKNAYFTKSPGRPMKLGPLAIVSRVFMKFRQGLSGMAVEALTGVDAVTLSRYVQKVLAVCESVPLVKGDGARNGFLVVDTTSVRVRSRCPRSYSGHSLEGRVVASSNPSTGV